jgi:hypothetical protein
VFLLLLLSKKKNDKCKKMKKHFSHGSMCEKFTSKREERERVLWMIFLIS